jgi:TPR repeat protein
VRTSEVALRHRFLSPYRCRDCRTRFWVVSRNSYLLAAGLGALVILGGIAWTARGLIELPRIASDKPAQKHARLPELLKLAAENDSNAEYELARMYANGFGVQKSLQEGHKWLERAARHGNVQAQYEYGVALRDGHGAVQDYEGARKWMQLASEAGNGQAQLALGLMYRTGLGMPIDNVKAYIWLNVAAAQGVHGASIARDAVLPRLSPAALQEAQAEARRLGGMHAPKPPSPSQ